MANPEIESELDGIDRLSVCLYRLGLSLTALLLLCRGAGVLGWLVPLSPSQWLTMLVVLGASLLFTAIAGPVIGSVLMQLLLMVITAMFFTSQYFSYLDCFVEARDSSTEV